MISQLGDPYSAYEPPQEALEFRQQLDQKFGGIGIEIAVDPETRRLTVASPMIGTPAFDAGILAGDQIVAIDGETPRAWTTKKPAAACGANRARASTLHLARRRRRRTT